MKLAPVVIFAYNRIDHLKKCIDAIRINNLANETKFYIFQDGAKNKESINYNEVTTFCEDLDFGKDLIFIQRKKNYGLFNSIISGIGEILKSHDSIIVLEDDLITSPGFLDYMNTCLNYYKDKKDVGTICGFSYKINKPIPNYYFLKGANPWGWATWKDRWELMDTNVSRLKKQLLSSGKLGEWDYGNGLEMLEAQEKKKISSWLICWHTSLFLKEKLTLFPSKSFVYQNGFDHEATHTSNLEFINQYQYQISDLNSSFTLEEISSLDISEKKEIRTSIQHFYHTIQNIPFTRKERILSKYNLMKNKLKSILKK